MARYDLRSIRPDFSRENMLRPIDIVEEVVEVVNTTPTVEVMTEVPVNMDRPQYTFDQVIATAGESDEGISIPPQTGDSDSTEVTTSGVVTEDDNAETELPNG